MKGIKSLLVILMFMMMSTLTFNTVSANEYSEGRLAKYIKCAEFCIENFEQWTWARSVCAADCYLDLILGTGSDTVIVECTEENAHTF